MKASPLGAQPGTLTSGSPPLLRYAGPRNSPTPMAPVTPPRAAGIPPQVAQVPMATVAAAEGARSRTQSAMVTGAPSRWPSDE